MKSRIAVDLVTIRPGKGGTGSGIWTYAHELIRHMDDADLVEQELICLINCGQIPFFSNLRNIRTICFPDFGKHILLRMLWVHLLLPLVCFRHRIGILHKLATETPLFCPVRRVTTVHDFYYEFLLGNHPAESIRLYERLENLYFSLITRTCFRKSRAVIAVSEATRQEAVARYPSVEQRISVIHHGASRPSPAIRPSLGQFNILCAAKFMEHKGQHLLIKVFETLLEENPELIGTVRLTLRGFQNDDDYYRQVRQQIDESRWREYVQIIPFSPMDSLEDIYKGISLVVLLSSYEGFGLPVLEAQSFGIPVLCSDLPVLRETGGCGAVYVVREDQQAATAALLQLISDSSYYEDISGKAVTNVQRFSWDKAARQTVAVYQQVAGS
jgi:glycosyltransferase involved in cell wall biosynthesis